MWGLSIDCVRDMFRKEPGVLVIDRPERTHKRGYSSIRIPASVAEQVHDRLQNKKRIRSAFPSAPETAPASPEVVPRAA